MDFVQEFVEPFLTFDVWTDGSKDTVLPILGSLLIIFASEFRRPTFYYLFGAMIYAIFVLLFFLHFVVPSLSPTSKLTGTFGTGIVVYFFSDHPFFSMFLAAVFLLGLTFAWVNEPPKDSRIWQLMDIVATLAGVSLIIISPQDCEDDFLNADFDFLCRKWHVVWAFTLLVLKRIVGLSNLLRLLPLGWFSSKINRRSKMLWYTWFSTAPPLLSEEEYVKRGEIETREGLEGLRQSVKEYKAGDLINLQSRLGSLRTFNDFVSGGDHVPKSQKKAHRNSVDFSSLLRGDESGEDDDVADEQISVSDRSEIDDDEIEEVEDFSDDETPDEPTAPSDRWTLDELSDLSNKEIVKVMKAAGVPVTPVTPATRGYIIDKKLAGKLKTPF